MLKKILQELILIRKELQAIQGSMESLPENESHSGAVTAKEYALSTATYEG